MPRSRGRREITVYRLSIFSGRHCKFDLGGRFWKVIVRKFCKKRVVFLSLQSVLNVFSLAISTNDSNLSCVALLNTSSLLAFYQASTAQVGTGWWVKMEILNETFEEKPLRSVEARGFSTEFCFFVRFLRKSNFETFTFHPPRPKRKSK